MTFPQKIEAYKELAASKGIPAATAAPPLWQVLWACGVNLPPPLFLPAVPVFLLSGAFFGATFGAVAWLMGNRGAREMSLEHGAIVAVISGAVFGLIIAWSIRRLARKHGFGSWSAFEPSKLRT